jgi:phosphoserine phosphatase
MTIASNAHPAGRPSVAACLFVDVDGTLVPGTSTGAFLAERLGHADSFARAEAAYSTGLIDNDEVCTIDAAGWRGRDVATVDAWLSDLQLIDGIAETVAWCRARAVQPVLATLAWTAVGSHLARRFGFATWCGPRLETDRGRYTGRVEQTFDEFAKRDFAVATAARLGVSLSSCAAVGDSRSDLPLFSQVGLSIAFNGTAEAKRTATIAVDGSDLTMTLRVLDAWITSRNATEEGR